MKINNKIKGYWVDEKDFLSPDFAISHAHRENNEKANQAKIMKSSPEIYVGEETLGNVSDITSLIKLCGGKIVDSITSSAICLGTVKDQLNCQRVKEQWLYGSIFFFFLQITLFDELIYSFKIRLYIKL